MSAHQLTTADTTSAQKAACAEPHNQRQIAAASSARLFDQLAQQRIARRSESRLRSADTWPRSMQRVVEQHFQRRRMTTGLLSRRDIPQIAFLVPAKAAVSDQYVDAFTFGKHAKRLVRGSALRQLQPAFAHAWHAGDDRQMRGFNFSSRYLNRAADNSLTTRESIIFKAAGLRRSVVGSG
jgi:hypothetical protein